MRPAFTTPVQQIFSRRRQPGTEIRPAARTAFNAESGLVYKETEFIFPKRHNADWIREKKTPGIIKKSPPNDFGTRSLFDMAKIKCAKEIGNFTSAHLEAVPWSVAQRLWSEIVSTHSESFHAWRILASAYARSEQFGDPAYRYHINLRQPTLPLKDYYVGLNSPDARWLAALRISPRQVSVPDLIAIADIKNLAVLDLSDGQMIVENRPAVFDERIMREWAKLAEARKAFVNLRVLLLGWQDTVSDWIFQYLDHFPSIVLVITTDCKNIHQKNRADWESTAQDYGWEAQHAKKSVKTLRPLLNDETFHLGSVSGCYYYVQQLADDSIHTQQPSNTTARPLVECRLGSLRTWTHILDEFPGTRTVWFENVKVKSRIGSAPGSDQNKRVRDPSLSMQSNLPPPSKRSHGSTSTRRRAVKQDAASLLQDLAR